MREFLWIFICIILLSFILSSADANKLIQKESSSSSKTNSTAWAQVSVSGISSGSFFATQYQVAHSASVVGAALFAGGPYYCAANSIIVALSSCMSQPDLILLPVLELEIRSFQAVGAIDSLTNLASQKVLLFSGKQDTIVYPGVVKKLEAQYRSFGVKDLKTVYDVGDEHAFPTNNYGNPCDVVGTPWINNCSYDGAGEALLHIYGNLKPQVKPVPANLRSISLGKFVPAGLNPSSISLSDTAFYYLPTGCQSANARCRIHVAFHGCKQYFGRIGDKFIKHSGFNNWAEANDIVVLYPQTIASNLFPYNPEGCWDWWGYADPQYSLKSGTQITTIHNLVNYFVKKMS